MPRVALLTRSTVPWPFDVSGASSTNLERECVQFVSAEPGLGPSTPSPIFLLVQRPRRRLSQPLWRSVLGCPGHHRAAGTAALTWSMCWPQPAQVVLPQVRQVVARHMVFLSVSVRSAVQGRTPERSFGSAELIDRDCDRLRRSVAAMRPARPSGPTPLLPVLGELAEGGPD